MDEMKSLVEMLFDIAMNSPNLELLKNKDLKYSLTGEIVSLVIEYLSSDNQHKEKQKLDKALSKLDRFVDLKIPRLRYWCFLQQFVMDTDDVIIDNVMRLRKANILESAFFDNQGYTVAGRTSADFVVELIPFHQEAKIRSESERLDLIHSNEFISEFEYLVTAFRLLTPSSVGINWVFRSHRRESFSSRTSFSTRSDIFPAGFSRRWNKKYHLEEVNWDFILRLRSKLKEVASMNHKETPRLLRSLRRYNRAICNDFIEDEVIDLWIILETIVKTTGKEVASRISEIVATSNAIRDNVKKELDFIYKNVRNPLFHGGSFNHKHEPYVDNLFIITSNALRAYLVLVDVEGGVEELLHKVKSSQEERKKLDIRIGSWVDNNFEPSF
jgi:hypothetical protein